MKIFYSKQVAEIDRYTIENEPIHSIDLMERASVKISEWIEKIFQTRTKLKVFVGPGNNGGDALAVSRLLSKRHEIDVYFTNVLSQDAENNLKRLKMLKRTRLHLIENIKQFPKLENNDIIIDGIFGSGLSRPLTGKFAELVKHINSSNCIVISIDIPSGLFGEDNSENDTECIIKAKYTLALQFPNISFMYPENYKYIGKFEILPIGLHPDAIKSTLSNFHYTIKKDIADLLIKREKFSHKGSYGHALLISGSYGRIGATVLGSKSCLRSGVGLVTVHTPKCGYETVQITVPEAMVMADASEKEISEIHDLGIYDAVGIGPGIGLNEKTKKALEKLLDKINKPLIIDADGINIISENKTLLDKLPDYTILTPHVKEFERLFGVYENGYTRNKAQIEYSKKYKIIIVLKGAHTSITTPDGICYFNSTGNPGMATAGSGDVLTGIILSLLAQGYYAEKAAIIAVYLHGLAGDIAVKEISEEAMIASDIIDNLGLAFKEIKE